MLAFCFPQEHFVMSRIFIVCCLLALAGCGLGETATSAAVGGVAKAKEIEQARILSQRVQTQVDDAARVARQRLESAEAASAQ